MEVLREAVSVVLVAAGVLFFLAGTVGLLRMPDLHTRLHALTKADNLGLGLIVAGLAVTEETWAGILKLFLIWGLMLAASSTASYVVARASYLSKKET